MSWAVCVSLTTLPVGMRSGIPAVLPAMFAMRRHPTWRAGERNLPSLATPPLLPQSPFATHICHRTHNRYNHYNRHNRHEATIRR